MVKNLPAMQETQVQSLGQEDPLEKGMDTTAVFLPGEFHGQRSLAGYNLGFPGGSNGKEPVCQCRRHNKRRRFSPWVGKIAWRRKWQPTPVFLSGECHGQRYLADYSSWGHTESNTTEAQFMGLQRIDMIEQLTLSLLFTLIHPQFIRPAIQLSFTLCLLSYRHFLGFFMWGLLKSNKFTIGDVAA